ncbi:MAG: dihydroorotate dehydrogenase-like protein, partial [Aureliella sp.]
DTYWSLDAQPYHHRILTLDTTTRYLGLMLDSPLVVSACPLTGNVESLKRLRSAGAAAAVLPSIFEEQIENDELEISRLLDFWALSSPETSGYFPEMESYNTGPDEYLDLIADAKRELDMPIIASLNGSTLGGWLRYAGLIERAGADALEINIYQVPDNPELDASAIEQEIVRIVRKVRDGVRLPLAVKLGSSYAALPNLARQLATAGAQGLVLFNRYLAPDIDLETRAYKPALELSSPSEVRLALRWIAILRDQVELSLAATGGVHSSQDVIKAMLAGADVVACASALLSHGGEVLNEFLTGLVAWLTEHDYASLSQMRGSMSMKNCPNPAGLKRGNYMRALTSYTPKL